jgi:putative transposase
MKEEKACSRPSSRLPAAPPDVAQPAAHGLFRQVLSEEFLQQILQKEKRRQNNRVYSVAVVMWLMILQRLQGPGTLQTAVLELLRGLPSSFWPRPCKRLQSQPEAHPLSSHTGAYNTARQELPVRIVEQCLDRVFDQFTQQTAGWLPQNSPRAFFFDGTSLRIPHSDALLQKYPPAANQYRESHWPLIRLLVAHDLYTGLALRPEWGPMYGSEAVSEQGLLEKTIHRLPHGSVVVGDANFGVFSVAYAAAQRGHPVVLRLTPARAQRLAGGPLHDGIDRQLVWNPSRDDRRNHPALPAAASLTGRLLVRRVQPSDGSEPFLLALFTTLDTGADEIVQLYGHRWNIETDLRSLKGTLELEKLNCTTPEMVTKEIDLAMLAYNLVRMIACSAARNAGLPPRSFSFTRVRNIVNTFAPLLATADERQAAQLLHKMMYYIGQAKLPRRKQKRPSYPRAVWGKTLTYPKRKV